MSITIVWFNKNHDMLTNSGKNSECKLLWNSVPWESLFHVGRWLDGQTWQGSQLLSALPSYLHLATCDLFFQNHVIFQSRQVHFQLQLLKTPPPSSLPHKSDDSVILVCAQTCHVCFMDGLHTIRQCSMCKSIRTILGEIWMWTGWHRISHQSVSSEYAIKCCW